MARIPPRHPCLIPDPCSLFPDPCPYIANTFTLTCHLVLSPGFSVTIPVSVEPHSLPNGSPKLNWCSTATKCCVGGAYTWIALICGDNPSMSTPYFAFGSKICTVATPLFHSMWFQLSSKNVSPSATPPAARRSNRVPSTGRILPVGNTLS